MCVTFLPRLWQLVTMIMTSLFHSFIASPAKLKEVRAKKVILSQWLIFPCSTGKSRNYGRSKLQIFFFSCYNNVFVFVFLVGKAVSGNLKRRFFRLSITVTSLWGLKSSTKCDKLECQLHHLPAPPFHHATWNSLCGSRDYRPCYIHE